MARSSSTDLAGVLPPAGQIFEKWELLYAVNDLPILFVILTKGFSRCAASGGSDV